MEQVSEIRDLQGSPHIVPFRAGAEGVAGRVRALCSLDEHADTARVEERHAREIDDDIAVGGLERSIELRGCRHVDLATDHDDARIALAENLDVEALSVTARPRFDGSIARSAGNMSGRE